MTINWVLSAIFAALSFTFMILIYKKLLLLNINQNILNLFIFGFVFIGFGIVLVSTKTPVKITFFMLILLIIAAVFSLLGNYFQVKAVSNAPNPGYAITLQSTSLILITILSIFLFKSSFSWVKLVGITVVILGSYLLSI